jgi:hypothetical protein
MIRMIMALLWVKAYSCLPFSTEYRPLQRLAGFSCSSIVVIEAYPSSKAGDIFLSNSTCYFIAIYNEVTDFVAR